ncbi:LysR substrate-binding domain-containing protein [Phenylobacterium immobile]|uniref:LysR substrate-binding domain-containing protein n=1 Tax=Phenylobacterium immobile TaxID=21 RepID=UPI000AD449ED|nr:LysR substrate-binding domain-containing protein [Phenylobacterium immobile]
MNPRQDVASLPNIATFVAAAKAGNFTRAAAMLGVTKSAVGKSIARLEQHLGVTLFQRTTRITRLTADGEAYFAACEAALAEIHAAGDALRSAHEVISGRLRVNMPVAFGRRVLLPLLLDMARPHPALSLSLTFTDAITDPLEEDVDILIRFGGLADTSHLIARRLVRQPRVICAAPSYLQARGAPTSLDDLQQHMAVVGSHRGPPLHWVVMDRGVERRILPPATHQMSDGEAMVEAGLAGLGIFQAPASLVRGPIARGALIPLLEAYAAGPVDVHALWPRAAQLSPKVRYVIDQLVACAARGLLD